MQQNTGVAAYLIFQMYSKSGSFYSSTWIKTINFSAGNAFYPFGIAVSVYYRVNMIGGIYLMGSDHYIAVGFID